MADADPAPMSDADPSAMADADPAATPAATERKEPELTYEQILEAQEALAKGYKQLAFQGPLHEAWAASPDEEARGRARQELSLPIQTAVFEKFGFEPSKKGVQKATNQILRHPMTDKLTQNHFMFMWLIDPSEQLRKPNFVPDAEVPVATKKEYPAMAYEKRSRWQVVGGRKSGGIVVRRGAGLSTPPLRFKLSCGAQIEAEDSVVDNRLHYKKLSGDGPDFGWISVNVKELAMVVPDVDFLAAMADN